MKVAASWLWCCRQQAKLLAKAQKPAALAYQRMVSPLSNQQQIESVDLLQQLIEGLEGHAPAGFIPQSKATK